MLRKITNGNVKAMDKNEQRNKNLTPFGTLSPEKQREISIKGGLARQKQVKERKSMKESLNVLLSMEVSREKAVEISGDSTINGTMTVQDALMIRAIKTAQEGNVKALEFIRDTSGNRLKDEIQIDGNVIMTDADRQLLENIRKRLE